MAFSGLYGLSQNCCHAQGQPVNKVGVGLAALIDVVASVAVVLLVVFGSKIGVKIPSMGQYMLGFAAVVNMMMLLHKNIVPVTENFRA